MAPFVPSVPLLSTPTACGEWSLGVEPYVHQLQLLPSRLINASFSAAALQDVYTSTNPFVSGFAFSLFLVPIFLVVSEINKNYSQVDRCWSILPTIYNVHYAVWAHLAGIPTYKLDGIVLFSVLWSMRLSFNYWRKGGYSIGSEDYRWEILRGKIPPTLFFVFNVLFISLAQSVLLFIVTSPTYVLLLVGRTSDNAFNLTDIVFVTLLVGLVATSFVADQQQWDFHQAKKSYQSSAKVPHGWTREDLDRGFLTKGLWAYSRHPNFAAEQAIWVTLYQWSCFDTLSFANWSLVGTMSYLILFYSSTWFTESVTGGKYPEYAEYQKRVGKFIPKFGTQPMPTPKSLAKNGPPKEKKTVRIVDTRKSA